MKRKGIKKVYFALFQQFSADKRSVYLCNGSDAVLRMS